MKLYSSRVFKSEITGLLSFWDSACGREEDKRSTVAESARFKPSQSYPTLLYPFGPVSGRKNRTRIFSSARIYLKSAVYSYVNKRTSLLTNTPPEKGRGQKDSLLQNLVKEIKIMNDKNNRKTEAADMEAKDMEAVVGGGNIGSSILEFNTAKEVIDSIDDQFTEKMLTGRGKC